MRRLFAVYVLSGLLLACSHSKKIEYRFTPSDRVVFDLLDRLKKNPSDEEAAQLLPDAYHDAAETRRNLNKNTYQNMSEGDRWLEIAKQLQVAQQLYSEIKANPAASKIIPNPWDPTMRIREARQNAAEEFYNKGIEYLGYNNRPYAQKAYDLFVKADQAFPNYKDVRRQMQLAEEMATTKVVVQRVDYGTYNWNYWGFANDYLQERIVLDLNRMAYRRTRFFIDDDARRRNIRADRIVALRFTDLYVGRVFTDNYTTNRSKQIEVGRTSSITPKPIYETVRATVYVQRSILRSHASLECRIYDWLSGRNFLFDRFPDNNTWQRESGRFTGDKRALKQSDWAIINSKSNTPPPSRNELVRRLVDNSYGLLLLRIRSGVIFD